MWRHTIGPMSLSFLVNCFRLLIMYERQTGSLMGTGKLLEVFFELISGSLGLKTEKRRSLHASTTLKL